MNIFNEKTNQITELNHKQQCAFNVLNKNRGKWVYPGAYPNIPWQSFKFIIDIKKGQWKYGDRKNTPKCILHN